MRPIEANEILEKVKTGLGITGNFQDEMLKLYIDEVKEFMLGAGVKQSVLEESTSIGVIIRGVADLWNFGAGNADFSPYFMMRVTQQAYKGSGGTTPPIDPGTPECNCVEPIDKDTIEDVFQVDLDAAAHSHDGESIVSFTKEEIDRIMR